MSPSFLIPHWPAPVGVKSLITTRQGGVSLAPYDSFNLGDHVEDDAEAVRQNRAILRQSLPAEPVWLRQVHGVEVVRADQVLPDGLPPQADAVVTDRRGVVCAIMTADCLPVLFASKDGSVIGAAHAGWRSLCAGILEKTLQAMSVEPSQVMAYLGPAIGAAHFEVGAEVREAFIRYDNGAEKCFLTNERGRWMADIFELARRRLSHVGMPPTQIYGGTHCTVSSPETFYSYRRDKQTGRMASLIWLE